jgi:hypothetical protein
MCEGNNDTPSTTTTATELLSSHVVVFATTHADETNERQEPPLPRQATTTTAAAATTTTTGSTTRTIDVEHTTTTAAAAAAASSSPNSNHDNTNSAWDVLPPILSLQPATNSDMLQEKLLLTDTISSNKNTDDKTTTTRLQYQMTPQHMGTLTLPTSRNSTTTTKNQNDTTRTNDDDNDNNPNSITTISANTPLFMTGPVAVDHNNTKQNCSSSSSSYFLIVGCHNGTICSWNLRHVPALRHYTPRDQDDTVVQSPEMEEEHDRYGTELNPNDYEQYGSTSTTTTTRIDPIHTIDTLTSIVPTHILDTTTLTLQFNEIDHKKSDSNMSRQEQQDEHNRHNTTTTTMNRHNSSHMIVQLCTLSDCVFVAINIVGMVYVVHMNVHGQLTLRSMWHTGRIGPTCMVHWCHHHHDNKDTPEHQIIIGYQTGYVECWSIPNPHDPISTMNDDTNTVSSASKLYRSTSQLQWRCNFANEDAGIPPSIAAMASFNVGADRRSNPNPPSNDVVTSSTAVASDPDIAISIQKSNIVATGNELPNRDPMYLVITLHNDGYQRPNTSAMVEVVDVTSIMSQWKQQRNDNNSDMNSDSNMDNNDTLSLSLEEHIVLPEAGREIVNVLPNLQQRSFPTSHWIPSRNTNCVCTCATSFSETGVVAVGHADGMITFLDVSTTTATNDQQPIPWGVSNVMHRYCLSYPCIGIGTIEICEDNDDGISTRYVVCSLRGSATYMIPLPMSNSHSRNDLPVLALVLPHDIDEDVTIRYTQGFAATNIVIKGRHEENGIRQETTIPLLAYVWPGGLIDIYSCGSLPHVPLSIEHQLLTELIANGSVDALRALILCSTDDTELMTKPKWTEALNEIHQYGETLPIGVNNIISDTMASLRSILLDLNS